MKRYTDFLRDSKFIRWQLFSDDALNEYWLNFIAQHPEYEEEIQHAIVYLKNQGLNSSNLDKTERALLLDRINLTIQGRQKVRRLRFLRYSAAVVILLLIGVTLFYSQREVDLIVKSEKEFIVGELLNKEDIQLITSEERILYQNDIDMELNEEGRAKIVQKNQEVQEVEFKHDRLNTLIIPYGKRSTLTLADGSKVWLNSGSVLEFPAQFESKKREIRLIAGEMYIEVLHDKESPFYVQTNDFNVRVYGTKFNISNYTGSPKSVVLVEGSISLQSKGHKEIFVAPSEKVIYSEKGAFDIQNVNVDHFISWKDGYLTFDKTPITEVLQLISRYYNLSFDYGQDMNLQKHTCSGKIYLSDNLDNVMATIALLSSTKYEKDIDKIYITNESE